MLADIETRRDTPLERRRSINDLRNPPRLIRREGVHRIDDDRLDPRRTRLRAAVFEDGKEEALRLARPGARRDQRGLRARQALERSALVPMRREAERNLLEGLAARRRGLER